MNRIVTALSLSLAVLGGSIAFAAAPAAKSAAKHLLLQQAGNCRILRVRTGEDRQPVFG